MGEVISDAGDGMTGSEELPAELNAPESEEDAASTAKDWDLLLASDDESLLGMSTGAEKLMSIKSEKVLSIADDALCCDCGATAAAVLMADAGVEGCAGCLPCGAGRVADLR